MPQKKYQLEVRGLDVTVMSKLWFGPWHSIMHGVYTKDHGLLGLFNTHAEVLEFVLGARHHVLNMPDVLFGLAEENRRWREMMSTLQLSVLQSEVNDVLTSERNQNV